MLIKTIQSSGLVKETDLNTKITEIENKVPNITSVVTTVAINIKVTGSENKVLDANGFLTKGCKNLIFFSTPGFNLF